MQPQSPFEVGRVLEEFGYSSLPARPKIIVDDLAGDLDGEFGQLADDISIRLGNETLPVFAFRDEIIQSVREHPVTIVVAETGAGKTTQIPQFLVEDGYFENVYITQPRRVAARNAYSRIRDEVSEVRGAFAGEDVVSCQTAAGREGPRDARVKVVTDGLQLAREFHDHGVSERDVLIIDEVHEWNTNIEILVAYAKANPNLRVLVMSATMLADPLADYFTEGRGTRPPVLEIPGRMHNVEKFEKPESTAVDEVIQIVTGAENDPGDILVFMPGKKEIQDTIAEITGRLPKDRLNKTIILPLHSKLSKTQQQRAIEHYPGYTKIVVSTGIAQTSLTIPGIKVVIDAGFERRKEIDEEGTPGLKLVPTSRADCEQRAGRTGRVSDGVYILTALNKTTPHTAFADRELYPSPEITRTDVARNMLRLKGLGVDIRDFDMYHNVSNHIIELAENNLRLLGALDEAGEITKIGIEMNEYPTCTSSARIMVESMRYHESTRAYLAAIVAVKEAGGLPSYLHNSGRRWQHLIEEDSSDLLAQLDLFIAAQNMTPAEMVEYDLDIDNFDRAVEQYHKIATIAGAPGGRLEPPSERVREDIQNCMNIGFLTSIYKYDGDGEYVHAFNDWPTRRTISNRSLVTGAQFLLADPYRIEGRDGTEDVKHFLENVSRVSASALGSIALDSVDWRPEGFVMREGKMKERRRQYLFGIDLGIVEEHTPEPSHALREEIIARAIESPGRAQSEIRKIKATLERLAHLANSPVRKITHDQIVAMVREAAPSDITNPAEIEDNLRLMQLDPERRISLDDFVSPERRERIARNAPPVIEVGEAVLHLRYRNSQPIASRYSKNQVMALDDEVYLPDGRKIVFALEGVSKKFSLLELKAKLADRD